MKKSIIIFLTIILCFVFTACTQGETTTNNSLEVVNKVDEAKEKLENAYELYGKKISMNHFNFEIAKLSADGMTLEMDTEPYNNGVFDEDGEVLSAIFNINDHLALPSSVEAKMKSTRAIDGIQSQDCGDYTVTWSYHPDNGLEVIYEVNK